MLSFLCDDDFISWGPRFAHRGRASRRWQGTGTSAIATFRHAPLEIALTDALTDGHSGLWPRERAELLENQPLGSRSRLSPAVKSGELR
ncbi:hypothetical protein [Trichocoleus sp. FACHB-262]|uniref:hypothetical protein n=1 Tax=Trichocoleus sp. FACHB-262 TaxID=2692869 RepID=UPI0016871D48|nr:hypothetical protein [Trichocoleus sp. FACHB-262]MBD2123508.1 hypothetical protein [Trichocoleus sp. FACHB-262]